MVSTTWAVVGFSLGVLLYILPPVLAPLLPASWRETIGEHYYARAMKSMERTAFVQRTIGGWEILPIGVDDEAKRGEVTLSSGMLSDDVSLPFRDPADCVGRLYKKPVAVLHERVPAAVDAELAEVGSEWERKHLDGKTVGEARATDGGAEQSTQVVSPWVELPDHPRAVSPGDVRAITPRGVTPENVETAKQMTKQRFAKYGSAIGMREVMLFTGFALGMGSVAVLQYVREKVIGGAGGGPDPGSTIGLGAPTIMPPNVAPLLVDVVGVVG